jgi:hypothetical protein
MNGGPTALSSMASGARDQYYLPKANLVFRRRNPPSEVRPLQRFVRQPITILEDKDKKSD